MLEIAQQINKTMLLENLKSATEFLSFIRDNELWTVTETYESDSYDSYVVELPEYMIRWYGETHLVFSGPHKYFASKERVDNLWFVRDAEFEIHNSEVLALRSF